VESFVLLHHLAGEQFRTGGAYIHCDAKEGPSKLLSQYEMCSRRFLVQPSSPGLLSFAC
jgi:hypothetical protein